MSRSRLLALVIAMAILAVGVTIALWSLVPPPERATAAAAVAGGAAVIQAMTAVVIVALTRRLAGATDVAQNAASQQAEIASRALEHAQEQARLSETSDRLARRDRHLLETPMVRATFVEYSTATTDALTLFIAVHNDGQTPALSVTCQVLGASGYAADPSPVTTESRIESLAGGADATLQVSLREFRNMSWISSPGPYGDDRERNPRGSLTYPWFAVRITYQGLLGQRVRQEYRLWAAGPEKPQWFYRALSIAPALEEVEPLELVF